MAKWKKQTLKLKDKHLWRARPGNRILVLDRGAVRFDIPGGWVLKMDAESVKVLDREPPADDCRIEVSFRRLPDGDFSTFPIATTLRDLVEKSDDEIRELVPVGKVIEITRHDLRAAWAEYDFIDPVEHRPAHTRTLLAIGGGIWCFVTMDFWMDDGKRVRPVWDEVVRTLRLGNYVSDPTTGAANIPHRN